jgi:catechol 2,3-dioxygenase-like lactoylglutathione lyase family enzyme
MNRLAFLCGVTKRRVRARIIVDCSRRSSPWQAEPGRNNSYGKKDATLPNDFPTDGVELRCFLVVSDYTRSLAFYRDVLGARVLRELPGRLCFLRFAGSQILLSAPFGSRSDQPAVINSPLHNHKRVIGELSIRAPDCSAAYEVLRSRGAEFLTPPFDGSGEVRAFFHDPDGHLLEIREVREAEVRSE